MGIVKRGSIKKSAKNKRGATSHLEMIIAFILFVLFVMFILFYVKPYKTTTLSDALLSGLHSSFKDKVSVNLTKVFVKLVPESSGRGCFSTLVDLSEEGNSSTINALKKEEKRNSSFGKSGPDILQVRAEPGDSSFYTFVSRAIQDVPLSCESYLQEYSTRLGSIEKTEIISMNEFEKLKERYDNDYDGLKKELKFPDTVDFGILSAEYNLSKTVPKDAEVIARSYNEYVLLDTGEIATQDFVFKIW